MLAHEIRRPLTTILLAAQHAIRSKDPGEAQTALQDIVSDASIGAKIVTEILRLSDADAPEKTIIDLNALVRETISRIERETVPAGVAILLELEEHLPPACASPTAVREVLINLVDNAVAAIAESGSVTISTRTAGDQIEIVVEDDGSGIAPEDLPRIFDPFYTTKSDRGGTGLGLVICRCLVSAHGGTIDVSSQLGRGTCFCVRFPAAGPQCFEKAKRAGAAPENKTAMGTCSSG